LKLSRTLASGWDRHHGGVHAHGNRIVVVDRSAMASSLMT
jgi:hypothetical protein